MSCTKLNRESIQSENTGLLFEILHLKKQMQDLYSQSGPGSSEYISMAIKLDLLQNEYINWKIEDIIGFVETKPNSEFVTSK